MNSNYLTFPDIDPVIFHLGPLALRWYGLMYLVGFFFAIWLGNKRADKPGSGWTREQISDLAFAGFLGVILGGRTGYVLFYQFPKFISEPLYLFKIWEGGMSFHGGMLGVIIAMLIYGKRHNRAFFTIADLVAPTIPIGLGAGRIGNFINGELWGKVTNVSWAIVFPKAGTLPRHPSQIYEFFLEGILLFIILNLFIKKPRPTGAVSGLFLISYGGFRFFIENFREPDAHLGLLAGVISMGQLLSLPMILSGIIIFVWAHRSQQHGKLQ